MIVPRMRARTQRLKALVDPDTVPAHRAHVVDAVGQRPDVDGVEVVQIDSGRDGKNAASRHD
jgi:hypothetical protein